MKNRQIQELDATSYKGSLTNESVNKKAQKSYWEEVTYLNEEDSSFTFGISEADYVFEYLSIKNRTSYKALFHNSAPKKVHPVLDIKYKSIESIPILPFCSQEQWIAPNSKNATSVFVAFNSSCFSNFIYSNGKYIHFKDTFKDIDKNGNQPVLASTIIVQFIEKNLSLPSVKTAQNPNDFIGKGSGLVFCEGKAMNINWTKEENSNIQITDNNNTPLLFIKGLTWWIIVDKNTSIAYN